MGLEAQQCAEDGDPPTTVVWNLTSLLFDIYRYYYPRRARITPFLRLIPPPLIIAVCALSPRLHWIKKQTRQSADNRVNEERFSCVGPAACRRLLRCSHPGDAGEPHRAVQRRNSKGEFTVLYCCLFFFFYVAFVVFCWCLGLFLCFVVILLEP